MLDIWVLVATIVSAIGVLASAFFALMTAWVSKRAVDMNIKMYEEQKEDLEKLYLPLFHISSHIHHERKHAVIYVTNKNAHQYTDLKFRIIDPKSDDISWVGPLPNEDFITVTVNYDFSKTYQYSIEIDYTTLKQKRYTTRIDFEEKDNNVTHKILETKLKK